MSMTSNSPVVETDLNPVSGRPATHAVRPALRFGRIAFIQSTHGQYLPHELVRGLTKAASESDLDLVVNQVDDRLFDDEAFLPQAMADLRVDGILVQRHIGCPDMFVRRLQQFRIPAVFVNMRHEYDCVYPDEFEGGRAAVAFLLGLGHDRIAYVYTADAGMVHFSSINRRAGYLHEIAHSGRSRRLYALPKGWETPGQPGIDQRVASAKALLSGPDRPTAVIAYELSEAMAVVHAAERLGLRIPQDLSLVVFHNRVVDAYFIPFQTISNVMEQVGAEAVDLLVRKIAAPDLQPARVVPMEMLTGATCQRPSDVADSAGLPSPWVRHKKPRYYP